MCRTEFLPWFLPKGWCAVLLIMGFFFLFFNPRTLWNPFLECQTCYDKSQILQANPSLAEFRDGWHAMGMRGSCCSSLNGFRKRGPIVEALSRGYEVIMETHLNSLHRRLPRTCRRETEGASREGGGCEGDKLQPSRVVRRAFRGT